ncbi:MAG: SPASM domain-containing protein [Xanthobacteraceae bacterium]
MDSYLANYQDQVRRMRASPYLNYPAHVHLETMAKCNAACVFCPYPTLDRQGERMPMELIEKVIDDLTAIPQQLPLQISPFKVNEPFLDVRLFDILKLINERLPQATITLTTNASAATEDNVLALADIKNLGYLWISFNDHRPAQYEAAMKLPYARTIDRLQMIHRLKTEGRLPTRIVLSRVGDGSPADREFAQWVVTTFPLFQPSLFPRGAWLGQVEGVPQRAPDVGCVRWFDISITATGVVAHCCMDGRAEFPIGDVSKQSVLEIYNNPEYRRLREATNSRLEVSPCNGCGFL